MAVFKSEQLPALSGICNLDRPVPGRHIDVSAVDFELTQVVIGSELRRGVGEPADGLGVLADVERGDGGGGDGHERSRVGASAVAILAGDEQPEGVGVLEVLREHVAHRRRELGHFDDALTVGQLDEPDDEDG